MGMLLLKQITLTDCFKTCLAMLLHCPRESVTDAAEGTNEKWDWLAIQKWLSIYHNKQLIMFDLRDGCLHNVYDDVIGIFMGPSPRDPENMTHAVVAKWTGHEIKVFHDPHPDNTGIKYDRFDQCSLAFLVDLYKV